jgi:hypothetical protein
VYEKIVGIREDGTWPSNPVDWQLTSCPDDPKPGFYYDAPEIRDTKVSMYSSEQWANYAVGDVLDEYKQWIGLKVAACSPKATVIYSYGPMHFKIKKVSSTKLKHVLQ